jgi:signal peptide peptidase SppA
MLCDRAMKKHGAWISGLAFTLGVGSGIPAFGEALDGSLDFGSSSSLNYEARNVFTHPAGLGYDTALNGSDLSTSFALASNPNQASDLAFATTFGYFGFGVERLAPRALSRYSLGLGFPLSSTLFLGTRLRLNRFDASGNYESWGLGFQYRPLPWLSFAVFGDDLNQSSGAPPLQTTFSTSVRPLRNIDLSVDFSTPSNQFLKTASAQGVIAWAPFEGFRLRFGYHTEHQWLAGVQFHFGNTSVFSSVQPTSARPIMVGFQSSITPYASPLSMPRAAKITIDSSLLDNKVGATLLSPPKASLLDLLQDLDEAASNPSMTALVIKVESFPLGLASAAEVHAAIQRVRAAGVDTEIYLSSAGLKEYLIASAGDRVYLEPEGEIRWLGLRAEKYFLKGLLDKVGIEGEFLAAGKYKSAPEMFLRKESSGASREATLDEMKSLETEVLAILGKARKIDGEKWKRLLTLGVLGSDEALKEGITDGVESYASRLASKERNEKLPPIGRRRFDSLSLPPRISVVVAKGSILPGKNRLLSLGGASQVSPGSLEAQLKEAESDERTKGVVLRVSSPGGEVLASQQIAVRIADRKKGVPLYVSMGDMAASGGYYICAPAHRIFAHPLTLTGSIGVFLGKFQFSGLYRWLDLHKEIVTSSPYPGLYSEDRAWSQGEKSVMERRLGKYYGSFISFVAKHRGLTPASVEEAAGGRVWTGRQALDKKLVDELGGYVETIRSAALAAGLGKGDFVINEIETAQGIFDFFTEGGFGGLQTTAASPLSLFFSRSDIEHFHLLTTLRDSPFLYLAPYHMLD